MKHENIEIAGLGADAKAFLARPKKLLIGGEWVDAASGKTFASIDPATEQEVCQIAEGDKADIDKAVKAARAAFEGPEWGKMRPADREKLLLNLADLMAKHADELAELEALDVGKVLMFAKIVDVARHDRISPLHGGLGDQGRGPDAGRLLRNAGPGIPGLYAASADRRLRSDHPLELPARHVHLEALPGAGDGQYLRAEACRADLPHRAPPR